MVCINYQYRSGQSGNFYELLVLYSNFSKNAKLSVGYEERTPYSPYSFYFDENSNYILLATMGTQAHGLPQLALRLYQVDKWKYVCEASFNYTSFNEAIVDVTQIDTWIYTLSYDPESQRFRAIGIKVKNVIAALYSSQCNDFFDDQINIMGQYSYNPDGNQLLGHGVYNMSQNRVIYIFNQMIISMDLKSKEMNFISISNRKILQFIPSTDLKHIYLTFNSSNQKLSGIYTF